MASSLAQYAEDSIFLDQPSPKVSAFSSEHPEG